MFDHLSTDQPIFAPESWELTEQQVALTSQARALAQERFAPRATRWDREAIFPTENYEDLYQAGLFGLCIPEGDGGLGADLKTYMLTAAEIGRYCGATALTFNMHICSTLWSGSLTDALELTPAQREQHHRHRSVHYDRILNQGKIYAQPFSEGNAAASGKMPFGTLAKRVEGGWRVNGRKVFASLSGSAHYYGVLATEDKAEASRRDTLYIAIPAEAEGCNVSGEWDPLGMRGTVSRTLTFEEVFVPEDAQLMPPGIYHQAAVRWPHMFMTLTPTYMGLMQGAFDFTIKYLRGEIPETRGMKRRMHPVKQLSVAQMKIMLEQTKALWFQSISEARVDPSKEERLRAYAAQYSVMENANALCQMAIRTCGGHSMLKTLPLERMYRDSRCGSLMLPWSAEISLERLGIESLYERGEKDD
jgi:alkylation response protein AidB-like acyl-CoA dehydrogenase